MALAMAAHGGDGDVKWMMESKSCFSLASSQVTGMMAFA
jgi:hypothetical protein